MTRPYRQDRTVKVEVRVTALERDAWDAAAAAAGVSRSEWLRDAAAAQIDDRDDSDYDHPDTPEAGA
jgi:hypothetical protein